MGNKIKRAIPQVPKVEPTSNTQSTILRSNLKPTPRTPDTVPHIPSEDIQNLQKDEDIVRNMNKIIMMDSIQSISAEEKKLELKLEGTWEEKISMCQSMDPSFVAPTSDIKLEKAVLPTRRTRVDRLDIQERSGQLFEDQLATLLKLASAGKGTNVDKDLMIKKLADHFKLEPKLVDSLITYYANPAWASKREVVDMQVAYDASGPHPFTSKISEE